MFDDCPNCKYENPPPPSDDFEYDFDFSSIVFTFPRPQYVPNVNFITIDPSLIHEDLLGYYAKKKAQTSAETIRVDETIRVNENIEITEAFEIEESSAEVSVTKKAFKEAIDKNKVSKENFAKNGALDKTKKKCAISEKNDSAVFPEEKERRHKNRSKKGKEKNRSKDEKNNYIDSDNSKNGKKKKSIVTKSSDLHSISKSYSISESDSDNSEKHKTGSSSHQAKSHSKKSSRHRKEDKDSRNDTSYSDQILCDKVGRKNTEISVKQEISFDEESLRLSVSKKAEIPVKKEVLSDDDNKKDKTKSSNECKKKYDDSRRRDDSRSRNDSRRRNDSRKNYGEYSSDDGSRSRNDSRRHDDSRKNYGEYSSDDDSRNRYYDESNCSSRNSNPCSQREIKQEIRLEPGSASFSGLNDYYCDVCKLNLNSETSFSSHMAGKKHKKALRQLSEQEVAKSSVMEIKNETFGSRRTKWRAEEEAAAKESQNFYIPPDMDRKQLYNETSKIQETCEEADLLIVGLDYVQEIRGYSDTKYFCELCKAQCVPNSIIRHLNGFNHRMNSIKKYCSSSYERIKDLDKRDKRLDHELTFRLQEIENFHGRGRIRVFEDVRRNPRGAEPYDPHQPSTSRQGLDVQGNNTDELIVTDEDCLSREYSDFFCRICKSHMNNYSMWESHARGKKHAKNKKSVPNGSGANSNFVESSADTISHLERMIEEECDPDDIIVGLNFIQENQGENGDLYNCFLCGSVCPSIDILDHLYLKKHKTKYLDKMNSDGYENYINQISSMSLHETGKEGLINEECLKLLNLVGRGKPVVEVTKKIF